jgi:DNA-binding transcriptional MerR regulator
VIGLVPGCGPQIVVATLQLNGAVPFWALVANALPNDGDALLPAIALAHRAAITATVFSTIPALIVAYAFHFLAPGLLNQLSPEGAGLTLSREGGPPMPDDRISFKDMCARFDVTPRTLRYYEYIELLSPIREGRARFYGPREVARMKLILRGRRFGFSLEEIRQWLLIYGKQGERPQLEHWLTLADRQLAELHRQRGELDTTIADLKALRTTAVEELSRLPEA